MVTPRLVYNLNPLYTGATMPSLKVPRIIPVTIKKKLKYKLVVLQCIHLFLTAFGTISS